MFRLLLGFRRCNSIEFGIHGRVYSLAKLLKLSVPHVFSHSSFKTLIFGFAALTPASGSLFFELLEVRTAASLATLASFVGFVFDVG